MELQFRQKLKKEIAVIIILFVVLEVLFHISLAMDDESFGQYFRGEYLPLHQIGGLIVYAIAIGYIFTISVLGRTRNKGSNSDISVKLLRVSKKSYWVIECFVNFVLMVMFYASIIFTIFCMMVELESKGIDPAGVTGSFTDIFKVSVLYSLIPLGAPILWIRNILFFALASMGLAFAKIPGASVGNITMGWMPSILAGILLASGLFSVDSMTWIMMQLFVSLALIIMMVLIVLNVKSEEG